jgi:hypothetical protein
MGTVNQVKVQSTPVASQLYMVAGVGAVLSALLQLASVSFTDWENPTATNTAIIVLGALGNIVLLPAIYALYHRLSRVSQGTSAIAALAGVLALAGATLGTVMGFDTQPGLVSGIFATFGILVWLGLTGYMALTHRLLAMAWAIFTMVLGVLGVTAGITSLTTGSESTASAIAWAVFSVLLIAWALWTGIELIRRARIAPTEA